MDTPDNVKNNEAMGSRSVSPNDINLKRERMLSLRLINGVLVDTTTQRQYYVSYSQDGMRWINFNGEEIWVDMLLNDERSSRIHLINLMIKDEQNPVKKAQYQKLLEKEQGLLPK